MSSFTYTQGIPARNNTPAQDQPNMLQNNDSNFAIWNVDHVGFNNSTGGNHIHVTFPVTQVDPSLTAGYTQIYPKTFGNAATYLESYAAIKPSAGNQINGYLPLVKAMVQFQIPNIGNDATLNTTNTINVNVTKVHRTAGNIFTLTFTNPLPYATYQVFFNSLLSTKNPPYTFRIDGSLGTATFDFRIFANPDLLTVGDVIGLMVI